jgi:serine/threonine protein kinase
MNDDGSAELCDSGLLPLIQQDEFIGEKTISTSFTTTARYMAPELIQGEQSSSFASDVYALGCVGYQVRFKSTWFQLLNSLLSFFTRSLPMRTLLTRKLRPFTRYTDKLAKGRFRHFDQMNLTKLYRGCGTF